jgi:hypothetical protein
MAANRYHWISSHAFELVLNIYRTNALPVQISTASISAQLTAFPIFSLIVSMSLDNEIKKDMVCLH